MNYIQQLQTYLDEYDEDELIRIIEDSELDDIWFLHYIAQEAIDTAEVYIKRLEDR
jgi:hypothetical protein